MSLNKLSIINMLKDAAIRITPIRLALIDYFSQHHSPAEVGAIIEFLQSNNLSPHKTTIYRDIEIFLQLGILQKIDLGDYVMRYELKHTEHHHHLVCTTCKTVIDVALPHDVDDMTRQIEKKFVFKITAHNLEFFGLCQHCILN